jgi:hypothetical protein
MIDYRLDPLWLRLNTMNAEGLAAFAPVLKILQAQMGQSADMAQRTIEEYRKFLFLAMRAGHQVIPPGPINDAWMAHIESMQNYWEALAQMISERPLIPGVDTKSFASMTDAWAATLESYERIFGTKPPLDIWGRGPAPENPWQQAMAQWRRMFGLG